MIDNNHVALMEEGIMYHGYRVFGAQRSELDGVSGFHFTLQAPGAKHVVLAGAFQPNEERLYPMRQHETSCLWETFVPGVEHGAAYCYIVTQANMEEVRLPEPYAFWTEPEGISRTMDWSQPSSRPGIAGQGDR